MKKGVRSLSLMLVLAMCIAALAGCTPAPAAKPPVATKTFADTFTYAQGADPRGLDPALVDDGESSKIIVNIYRRTGLHVQAEAGRQVPRRHRLQRRSRQVQHRPPASAQGHR
jgi:ABC-type oligopeptide transport system substrate-binding subunit